MHIDYEHLLLERDGFDFRQEFLAGQLARPFEGRNRGVGPGALKIGLTIRSASGSPWFGRLRAKQSRSK